MEPIIHSGVSQKEKHQYSIPNTYIWNLEMVTMTLYARQQKRHRCKEQTFGLWREGEGGMILKIALKRVYYHM